MNNSGPILVCMAIGALVVVVIATIAVDCERRGGTMVQTPYSCECVRAP